MKKLPRDFYNRDTIIVAKELLGKYLIHRINQVDYIGKIVEVEAYLGSQDLAAHSSKGITPRTAIMFGPAGYAYVYLIYGLHHCFNVVTEQEGHGAAVLIRAIEPIQGIVDRTQGPGLVCRAMRINKKQNGQDLLSDELYIAEEPNDPPCKIVKTTRIGVNYARHWAKRLLRFHIKGSAYISK